MYTAELNYILEYVCEEIEVLKSLEYIKIDEIGTKILDAHQTGGRVYIIGNGGSSANASHWVNDLKKSLKKVNNGFDVISLTDNVPLLTAYANDVAYEDIFLEQIKDMIRPSDLLLALSVSGSSSNLVNAFRYAKGEGACTISIVGDYNGKILEYSDINMVLATKNYGIAEDIQQSIVHILVERIKKINGQCGGI